MRDLSTALVLSALLCGIAPVGAQAPATAQEPPRAERASRPPSPAQQAVRDRMRRCGAEWQAAKAAGTTNGQRWNDFRAACFARLRAQTT
jgi:hypothetical protein